MSSFIVSGVVSGVTSVDLKVSTHSDMSSATLVGSCTVDQYGTVRWEIDGLTANTVYYARMSHSGTFFGDTVKVRTLPASGSFTWKVQLGSCQKNLSTSITQLAWEDALSWAPDLNVFVGDYYYSTNITTGSTVQDHVDAYVLHLTQNAGMYASLKAAGTEWEISDHEESINGDVYPKSDYDIINARQLDAFQRCMPVTLADTRFPKRGRYYSFNLGPNIKIIMTDFRTLDRSAGSDTDGPGKTMFGATQLAWILNELDGPEILKVLVNETSWLADPTPPGGINDKPWTYRHEQQIIANHIVENGINVDWWGGDRHYVGYLSGAHNTLGGFPCVIGSCYEKNGLKLSSGEVMDSVFGVDPTEERLNVQYMRITLADDGAGTITRTCTAEVWDTEAMGADPTDPGTWVKTEPFTHSDSWSFAGYTPPPGSIRPNTTAPADLDGGVNTHWNFGLNGDGVLNPYEEN